jgi:NAD(P)-dependent dehydrogenase (short-subunit alcohol dehydrogenase family)
VAEIEALGGHAVASQADAADVEGAQSIVDLALRTFGRLDVMVNNAGILRDRMLVNMSAAEWDSVIHVHLRSVFACSRAAAAHWRERSKSGETNDARIINTTSPSGLYGNLGQANYGAAKAGIAGFTVITAQELARYGVTVNAIAPGARTRMTDSIAILDGVSGGPEDFDSMAPGNVSPLVAWLGSDRSSSVTGRVFNIWGGRVSIAQGWSAGPGVDLGRRWNAAEFSDAIPGLIEKAAPTVDNWGDPLSLV